MGRTLRFGHRQFSYNFTQGFSAYGMNRVTISFPHVHDFVNEIQRCRRYRLPNDAFSSTGHIPPAFCELNHKPADLETLHGHFQELKLGLSDFKNSSFKNLRRKLQINRTAIRTVWASRCHRYCNRRSARPCPAAVAYNQKPSLPVGSLVADAHGHRNARQCHRKRCASSERKPLGFYGERRVGKPSVARYVGFGVVLERAGSKTETGRPGTARARRSDRCCSAITETTASWGDRDQPAPRGKDHFRWSIYDF